MCFPKFHDLHGDLLLGLRKAVYRTTEPRPDRFGRSNANVAQRYAEAREGIDYESLGDCLIVDRRLLQVIEQLQALANS